MFVLLKLFKLLFLLCLVGSFQCKLVAQLVNLHDEIDVTIFKAVKASRLFVSYSFKRVVIGKKGEVLFTKLSNGCR